MTKIAYVTHRAKIRPSRHSLANNLKDSAVSLTPPTLLEPGKTLTKKYQSLKSCFEVAFGKIVFFDFTKNGYEGTQELSFFRKKSKKKRF